jgi:hypothetical protein
MRKLAYLFALLGISGCASISGGKMQPVTVQTSHDNIEVAGIRCTLQNDVGTWTLTSPASEIIHKSTEELVVDCKNDRIAGTTTAGSKVNGAYLSNFLFLFGVGYIIDRFTGAGFDYPATINVTLHQIDQVGNQVAPTPANTAVAVNLNSKKDIDKAK